MSDLIATHLAHLRAAGYSPHTITAREDVLHRLHAHLPYGLAYAATEEIEGWLGQEGWSRWTRCTYAMHIRGFYRWATSGAAAVLDGDPTADMARPRTPRCVPKPVTEAELALALQLSAEPWVTCILLAAAAGLRASEIARLRREDVERDAIYIAESKGGDPDALETHPVIWEHLQDRPPGLVVTDPAGQQVTGRWLSIRARFHFDAIGMPRVHLHRFRHYFATALLEQGASLRTVQELMRHRSVTSTQGYTAVRSGQRRNAIATLPIPTSTPQSAA